MWLYWTGMLAVAIYEARLNEYNIFIRHQGFNKRYKPTQEQYFLASAMAYKVEHPPKQVWYKTCVAVVIKKLFKL